MLIEERRIFQRIRSRRADKAKKRRKTLRKKRIVFHRVPEKVRQYLNRKRQSVKVIPPANFSFINNTNKCISTIEELYYHLNKKKGVFIQFKELEIVTDETVVVLLSVFDAFISQGVSLIADEPKNREACRVFEKSGIAEHVGGYIKKRAVKDKNGIYSHNNLTVQSELSHQLIGEAAETIWGEKRSCPGVQRVLIECMANTYDHANPRRPASHNWWLSTSHNEDRKVVSFSFVDLGVGIFESLHKQKLTKFKNFFLAVFGRYKNNAELFKLIVDGELKKSRTGNKNRGNGLPSIAKALTFNQIDNLIIISNNVFADLKSQKYEIMKNRFSGTFIYWELNQNCTNKPWVQ